MYTPYQLQLKKLKGKSYCIMFNNIFKLITEIRCSNNTLKFINKNQHKIQGLICLDAEEYVSKDCI